MEHLWTTGLIALVFSSCASSKQQYIMETPYCHKCTWNWDTSAFFRFNGSPGSVGSVCSRCQLNVQPFLTPSFLARLST